MARLLRLTTENNKFRFAEIPGRLARKVVPVPFEVFDSRFKDGRKIRRREWRLSRGQRGDLKGNLSASKLADRIGGKKW